MAFGLTASSVSGNLLVNPGFEISSGGAEAGWIPWGNANTESWARKTGTNGLAFYGWTTGGGAYQDVFANGSSNYTFSIYGFCDKKFTVGGCF